MPTDETASFGPGSILDPQEVLSDKDYPFDAESTALLLADTIKAYGEDSEFATELRDRGMDTEYRYERIEKTVMPNQQKLLRTFRELDATRIFLRTRVDREDASDWPVAYRDEMAELGLVKIRPGTEAYELLPGFECREDDYSIDKRGVSGFHNSSLPNLLRNEGIEHLVLTGAATNYAVGTTAIDAANRGYYVTIVEDGTVCTEESVHTMWLNAQDFYFQCLRTEQVLEKLSD